MSSEDIVRAWKDPDRRGGADIDHPAGEITLDVAGGTVAVASTEYMITAGCCGGLTSDTCFCDTYICTRTFVFVC